MQAHRPTDAVTTAAAAMSHFANSPHAAEIAARADVMAGRWDDAILAAQQWRARGLPDPMSADIVIAAANMFAGKSHDAVTALAPYIADARKTPGQFVDLIMEYSEALIRDGRENDAAALLRPLAANSDLFRYKWLEVAQSSHRDADSTLAWIEKVHPLLRPDSFPEQNALAQTYFAIAQKYASDKAFEGARDTLKPFIDKPVMDKAAMLLLGNAAAASGDLTLAEQMPRAVLQTDPKDITAMNDLAEVLSRSFDAAPLKEAENLARAVCDASANDPAYPDYLNTLARILRKQGRSEEAIAALEQARLKTPADPTILIGLADAYARSNQIPKAAQCLDQIDALLPSSAQLSLMTAAELKDARDLVRKTNGSAFGEAR
jgi:tetratricopeptide (TPR) repeat protein